MEKSWIRCGAGFAQTADGISQNLETELAVAGNIAAAGAEAERGTLVDDAIVMVVPMVVEGVGEMVRAVIDQLLESILSE